MGNRPLIALIVIALSLASWAGPWGGVEPGEPAQSMNANEPTAPADPGPEIDLALSGAGYMFIENLGQLDDPDVRFYVRGDPLSVLVTVKAVVFLFNPEGEGNGITFTMWLDGAGAVVPTGRLALDHKSSFIYGNEPERWVVGARAFSEVVYEGIYHGVDMRLYFADGMLKYDIVLEPGVDPSSVRMAYDGITGLSVDDGTGDLFIETPAGTLRDSRPVLLQEGRPSIAARYRLDGHGWYVEPVGEVDPTLPLVIDPGLEFSTRLGGNDLDKIDSVFLDANGDVCILGLTESDDFPLPGTRPGNADIFLMRFADVTEMPLSTMYVGGSDRDYPWEFKSQLLDDGRLLLAGSTHSPDFPTTADAYQDQLGGIYDNFILVTDADWTTVEYSTLLGGSSSDNAEWLLVGENGNALLAGSTNSRDLPTTPGSFCATIPENYPSNYYFYYLLHMDLDPPAVNYCTYLTGNNRTIVMDVFLDNSGEVHVIASTSATDLPTTSGSLSDEYMGKEDLYLARLARDGSLVYSTYIGGSEWDSHVSATALLGGGVYIMGRSNSTDFTTTPGAHRRTLAGRADAYLVRYDIDSSSISYSTYFGGDLWEEFFYPILLPDGELGLIGYSMSTDLPVTGDALQSTNNGGDTMVLLARFGETNGTLLYCSYLGGSTRAYPLGYMVLPNGNILLHGRTSSADYPTTPGALQTGLQGTHSAFLTELNEDMDHIEASTLIGGSDEYVYIDNVIRMDNGSLFCIGSIGEGISFPTTSNALCPSPGGSKDITILVLDEDLSDLQYGTVIGGDASDYIEDIEVSDDGRVGLLIRTDSTHINTTFGCYDALKREIYHENYICSFNLSNLELEYASYFGTSGTSSDPSTFIRRMTFDAEGHLLLFGGTESEMFPTWNATFSGNTTTADVFITKLSLAPCDLPLPPTNVSAVGSDGFITLRWNPPVNRNGMVNAHRIYRGTSPDDMDLYVLVPCIQTTLKMHIDNDVINGVTYHYEVRAVNSQGESQGVSAEAMPRGAPTTPLELETLSGDGSVTLTWDPPNSDGGYSLQGYLILRGPMRDEMDQVASVGKDMTTWKDGDVTLGGFYYYAVIAHNGFGQSPSTETLRIKVTDVPTAPPGFDVIAEDGKVTLIWGYPVSNGGATILGFRVWRMEGGGEMAVYATLGADKLTFIDTNVTNGRQYTYTVTAFTNVGEGRNSEVVDATPFGLPGEVMEIEATAGVGEVTLEWSPPEDDGGARLKGYVLFWGTVSGNLDQEQKLGNTTSFVHSSLTNGDTYYYQIWAENAAGLGPVSVVVHATPWGLPGPVRELAVEAVPAGVRITWTLPSETGGVETLTYRVLRGTTDDPIDLVVELVDAFEHLDDTVVKGTTYHYRVVAVSTVGEGAPGSVEQVTAAGVPSQIMDVVATVGNAIVELTWTAPDDGGSTITEYVIFRGVFEDVLTEVGRTANPGYSDGTAENGKTYYYRVYAVNAIGNGERSEVLEAMPLGPPPSPGVLEAKTKDGKIVLTWIAPAGGNTAAVTGYKVYRGDSEFELEILEELGLVTTYTDGDIKEDRDYYYKVVAVSDSGDSELSRLANARVRSEEEPGFGAALAVLAMASVVTVAVSRRRSR